MNESMIIRKAVIEEMDILLELYANARKLMRSRGNMHQWTGGYPSSEVLESDIMKGNLYVAADNSGKIQGAFAFIEGEDPTYSYIEGGKWIDNGHYGTIHRIVSSGEIARLSDMCIKYCLEKTGNVRIDTHADNKPMQEVIQRNGFTYCGIIYIADGSPRMAYQCVLHTI